MKRHSKRMLVLGALIAGAGFAAYHLGPAREAVAQDAVGEAVEAVAEHSHEHHDHAAHGEILPVVLETKDVSLELAHEVLAAAIAKSNEIGTKMDVAIVDAGGNLKAFVRQDGAWLGSIDISIKKAKTARYFDMPTGAIGQLSKEDGPLYNIEHSNGGLITFPGGVPLVDADGTVIGAIGVSGSTVENDHTVAAAGAAVLSAEH